MSRSLLRLEMRGERDVVAARQRARQVAALLELGGQDQIRVATAVSEIARNAVRYAGGGEVEFLLDGDPGHQMLRIRVRDRGPGIVDLARVLDGSYASTSGMGVGITGTRRIMDVFHIETHAGQGTEVELGKALPPGASFGPAEIARLSDELVRQGPRDAVEELQLQNRELLRTLDELRTRQQELVELNHELEDTNRGVVALYAELDDRVEQLRRANALRAQFTSYLSHEFRSPLDSVIALSGLLLNRVDGELTAEQEKQVGYIRRSAQDLLHLVDDLLDSARVEAGQVVVRPAVFTVAELFNALRATMRPLLTGGNVSLTFESAPDLPPLHTDEAKLSQILRNFISNAVKFTERGEIRVEGEALGDGERVQFLVRDTGVGIAQEDQRGIFEDFVQVESPVQRKVKGTGLGLALSRKLARLLGGEVAVESVPGVGSTFSVVVPREYEQP